MAGDQEAVASGKWPWAIFCLPLQNHCACSALRPERLISRGCANRLSCLWVRWDSVSGRHQQATTGWQSQAQSLNPPEPLCWAAWSSLHFPSTGLSSYQEPSLPAASPAPSGQNQGLLVRGTVSSFVGFPKLSWYPSKEPLC